jgi:hypothetical protein
VLCEKQINLFGAFYFGTRQSGACGSGMQATERAKARRRVNKKKQILTDERWSTLTRSCTDPCSVQRQQRHHISSFRLVHCLLAIDVFSLFILFIWILAFFIRFPQCFQHPRLCPRKYSLNLEFKCIYLSEFSRYYNNNVRVECMMLDVLSPLMAPIWRNNNCVSKYKRYV